MLFGPPLTGHCTSAANAHRGMRTTNAFTPMNYNRTHVPNLLPLLLAAKAFSVDGIVVAVDPMARTMLVSHRPIAKYMPAMMMPFRVAQPDELNGLYPGARVHFELVVGRSSSFARRVIKTGDGEIPPPKEKLRIGGALGDFNLRDQQGKAVRL